MTIPELKTEVLALSLRCYDDKLMAGTSGNLSALSDDGKIVITPGSVDYSGMTTDDIMVIETDGTILEGPHKPSSEWRLHAEIYKSMTNVKAVVHTHSPYATSFAVIGENIPAILNEMIPFLGGDVPVSEYASAGTKEVGENAVKSLQNRNACLMRSHGALAVGENLQQAYIRATYIEDAAKICHMAKCIGKPIILTEEQQAILR